MNIDRGQEEEISCARISKCIKCNIWDIEKGVCRREHNVRTIGLGKSEYQVNIFLISPQNHMLGFLIRHLE